MANDSEATDRLISNKLYEELLEQLVKEDVVPTTSLLSSGQTDAELLAEHALSEFRHTYRQKVSAVASTVQQRAR